MARASADVGRCAFTPVAAAHLHFRLTSEGFGWRFVRESGLLLQHPVDRVDRLGVHRRFPLTTIPPLAGRRGNRVGQVAFTLAAVHPHLRLTREGFGWATKLGITLVSYHLSGREEERPAQNPFD